jgi:lycopene cyclase domain-containing protein
VRSFTYLGVMLFVVVGSGWLELVMRTHVLRRWRRLLLSLAPVVVVFYAWDAYAIGRGHWTFDSALVTGVVLPGGVPLEELVFFVVVPLAAVLTLEAVRSARGWDVGDGAFRDADPDGAEQS